MEFVRLATRRNVSKPVPEDEGSHALVAAVAHVDNDAWRYLLENHCLVNFGVEGEAVYEEKILFGM